MCGWVLIGRFTNNTKWGESIGRKWEKWWIRKIFLPKNCYKLFSEFVRTLAHQCMGDWRRRRHRLAPFRFVQWNVVNFIGSHWFTLWALPTVSFYRKKIRTSLWGGCLRASFQVFKFSFSGYSTMKIDRILYHYKRGKKLQP